MRVALAMTTSLMAALPAWAQETGPAAAEAPSTRPIAPQVATSHAQIAQRLAQRGSAAADGKPTAADARVEAAAKSTEQAIADDPTVRELVRQDPTLPPSLAGGAPAPKPAPGKSPP